MKKKLLNGGKGKFLRRLFSAMLVIALLSTGVYTDVSAGGRTLYSDSVREDTGSSSGDGGRRLAARVSGTDIFDDTSITLDQLTLEASYQNENGETQVVKLAQGGEYDLPLNASIYMKLEFVLGDPSQITKVPPVYTYKVPDGITVREEAEHELSNSQGKQSIGRVHISKDGTLTFTFYDNIPSSNYDIPFYVWFKGGLDNTDQEAGSRKEFEFPTDPDSSYNFSVVTKENQKEEETPLPSPVPMEKSGRQVINENGRNYIEWTVALGPNKGNDITGIIHDDLPAGLTYAAIPDYPKVSGLSHGNNGQVTTNAKDGDTSIDINVIDCNPEWRAYVTFCTYYEENVFGNNINAGTGKEIKNTASFLPENNKLSTDEGQVYIRPDMLNKTGSKMDANGNITWTVVINREKLNLNGVTYEDTFGEGQTLVGEKIEGIPNDLVTFKPDGFKVEFPNSDNWNTYTLVYTTHVDSDKQAQSNENFGKLTGGHNGVDYNVEQKETVQGISLIQKSCKGYDPITNRFTWQIIVNPDRVKMGDGVTVEDTFLSKIDSTANPWGYQPMKFVSATVATVENDNSMSGEVEINPSRAESGNNTILTFNLGNIDNKCMAITVITEELKQPEQYGDNKYPQFENRSKMTSTLYSSPEVSATRSISVSERGKLIDKRGVIKDDGTVEWTVSVLKSQLEVKNLTLTDTIPDGMEYVPKSFKMGQRYYDGEDVERDVTLGKSNDGRDTISYTLTEADRKFYKEKGEFAFRYRTRITDWNDVVTSKQYTNHAEVSVEYEGVGLITDYAEDTVPSDVSSVLNKTYDYRSVGGRDIEWTVTVNAARTDMSDIQNPRIYDDLADYFDYVEDEEFKAKLYKVKKDGSREEVEASEYKVAVVNKRLTVQLPQINDDCYEFVFRTKFNCDTEEKRVELEKKLPITNTVSFRGTGVSINKESNSINSVNFAVSGGGSDMKREIRVKKIDSATEEPLEGATFKLFLNGEEIGEATSDEDGLAVFECESDFSGLPLTIKETQAPAGYEISDEKLTIDYNENTLKQDGKIKYCLLEFKNTKENTENTENTGDILIKKVNDSQEALQGAEIELYSEDMSWKETQKTNPNGEAVFKGYSVGTYYVKEKTPPPGYKLSEPNNTIKVVIAKDADDKIQVTYGDDGSDVCEIENVRAVGSLIIKKTAEDGSVLSGAEFGIYEYYNGNDLMSRLDVQKTDETGTATFSNLELGKTYYCAEIKAPNGYMQDTAVHSIKIGTGNETVDLTRELPVTNKRAEGNIVITKTDDSMPDRIPLSGVKFQLRRKGSIDIIDEQFTDDNGIARFDNISFGEYEIIEPDGKPGYAKADTRNITVTQTGDTEVAIVNNVIKCDIRIIKVDAREVDAMGNKKVLPGAVFELYKKRVGADGEEQLLWMGRNETDINGKVEFGNVEYGEYVIKELKAPDGYTADPDAYKVDSNLKITSTDIEKAFDNNAVIVRTVENEKENGSIWLRKYCEGIDENNTGNDEFEPATAEQVATFTLFDEKDPDNPVRVTSDADGWVKFEGLHYGTYRIQETKAPDGFVMDRAIYQVVVDSDGPQTMYVENGENKPLEVKNERANAPYISVKLIKFDSKTNEPVADATFTMYKTLNGKDEIMGTAVTDTDGIAIFKQIHIDPNDPKDCNYYIKETLPPVGYKPNLKEISLGDRNAMNSYADPLPDTNVPLDEKDILWVGGHRGEMPPEEAKDATVTNDPIKGKIWITKTTTDKTPLEGVVYELYQEDEAGVKVPAKGVSNTATTQVFEENGKKVSVATFTELPRGVYYVREISVPDGYTLNEKEVKVIIADDEKPVEIAFKDAPIEIWVSKQAVGGNAEIAGAQFRITKEGDPNTTIDSWTSSDANPRYVITNKMQIGTTYVLSEEIAPKGYGHMPDVYFTINSDGSISTTQEKNDKTIIVRDRPINLKISKQDVTASGTELANVTLAIYDANGLEVCRFPTNGITPYEVPVGKLKAPETKTDYNVYTLRELSAPDGYEIADDITFSVDWEGFVYKGEGKNRELLEDGLLVMLDKPKGPFYIRKLDATTGLDVRRARFQLYYGYDVEHKDGILFGGNDDGLVEGVYTQGKALDIGQYVAGSGTYRLVEHEAPKGYLFDESNNEVVFTYTINDGIGSINIEEGNAKVNAENDTIIIYNSTFELNIRKQDSYGKILSGAKLVLSEYDNDKGEPKPGTEIYIDTTDSIYTVSPSRLVGDMDYVLHEETAPYGYQTAGDIIFHIAKDGTITRRDGVKVINNTIVMEDELGVSIGKFDLANDTVGLGECELQLESKDDKWWKTTTWWTSEDNIDVGTWDLSAFTPGCTYILTELTAPSGYAYTAPITFTIDKDTLQVYYIVDGEQEPVNDRIVKIKDGKLELTVSKQDSKMPVEVPGAQLSIWDKNNMEGDPLATWTSGSEPCEVDTSQLIAGNEDYKEYILCEDKAPNGYYKAENIPFAIDRDGNIYLDEDGDGQYDDTPKKDNIITMYDDPMLSVEKLDTSGNRVEGAKLIITTEDDPYFEIPWDTTQEIHAFEDGTFTPGVTYVLTEKMAPKGYGYAQSIEFTVTDDNMFLINGEDTGTRRIVMLDYPIKVLVSKQDGGNRQPLAGAKLVIKDETGKPIHTFTSTGEPVLLPNEIFKSVQGGLTYYTLSEDEAPNGYYKAADIAFAIDSSGNLLQRDEKGNYVRREDNTLVMLDYAGNGGDGNNSSNPNTNTNTNASTTGTNTNSVSANSTKAPKTGDSTPLGTLIALCAAGFLGAGVIFGLYFRRRRRRRSS